MRGDVLRFAATPSAERDHPVQKPVEMLAELLVPTLPCAGILLDPFAGSGTSLVAAKASGARAIGIEGEENYCEVAANSLRQTTLFAPSFEAGKQEVATAGDLFA